MARTLLWKRDDLIVLPASSMKTIVISLSLLLLLLACGKLPEDPKVPRKPVLPGTASSVSASASAETDGGGLFGNRVDVQRRFAVRSM